MSQDLKNQLSGEYSDVEMQKIILDGGSLAVSSITQSGRSAVGTEKQGHEIG